MNQRTIMLVCAALAAASLLATCADAFDDRYLDLAEVTEADKQVARRTLESLKQFLVAGPNGVQSAILRYRESGGTLNPHVSAFLLSVNRIGLVDQPDVQVMSTILQVCAILRETQDDSLDILRNFLYARGRVIFSAANIEPYIEPILNIFYVWKTAESIFDNLFSSIWNISMNDSALLESLQNLDLTTTSKDITPAYNFARYRGFRNMEGPIDAFVTIMNWWCSDIGKNCEFNMALVSFAKAFDVLSEHVPLKVQKLNEYNRLCLSLTTQMEDIKENLNGNLPNQSEPRRRGPRRGHT